MSEDKFDRLKHLARVRTSNNAFREIAIDALASGSLPDECSKKLNSIIELLDAYREAHLFALNFNLDLHDNLKKYADQKKSEGPVTEAEANLTNNLFELLKSGRENVKNFKLEPELSVFKDLINKN